MNIYIDFEANARSKEIISIGAVSEVGHEFYSLVKPHDMLNKYTIDLTSISQEDVDNAPSIEEVMEDFFRWSININGGLWDPHRYVVYRTSDRSFINTSISLTKDKVTKLRLEEIRDNLFPIHKTISKKFHRNNDIIGLRSAYLTMRLDMEDPPTQNHNALEDAYMLKWVCEHIDDYTLPKDVQPVEVQQKYKKKHILEDKYNVKVFAWCDNDKFGHREWHFDNVRDAVSIFSFYPYDRMSMKKRMDMVLNAMKNGTPIHNNRYFAYDKD